MILDTTKNIYNSLPEIYRKMDLYEGNETLLRYISTLDNGGFRHLRFDIDNLYNVMSIEKAPQELIPIIGKMLGYNYVEEVDDRTQRKVVENLVELYKRKGTKSAINFIIREFTEYDTKLIQTEYRIFKTWSPKPKGVPQSEYVESRTLGSDKQFYPNPNTCYLVSDKGKYNGTNVIIYVVDDADENSLIALNNILREFMPVGCRFHIQGIKVNTYTEETRLLCDDSEVNLCYLYSDSINFNTQEQFSNDLLKEENKPESISFNPNEKYKSIIKHNLQKEQIPLNVVISDSSSLTETLKETLQIFGASSSKDLVRGDKEAKTFKCTTKDTLKIKLFDEETLPIIGTYAISEED